MCFDHAEPRKAILQSQPSPYGNSGVKEFSSYGEMAKVLNERENDPSPEVRREAKQIKDKLFTKMLRGKQETFVMEIPSLANAKWEDQINKQLANENPRVREEAKERLKAWNNFKVKVKGDSE